MKQASSNLYNFLEFVFQKINLVMPKKSQPWAKPQNFGGTVCKTCEDKMLFYFEKRVCSKD